MTMRAFVADPKALTPAVEHLQKIKIYPLNDEASAKPMKFPDASAGRLNLLPRTDNSAFDQLKDLLDSEGDHFAGPDWLGMLASIGIVKGQPFKPDAHSRAILDQAAITGFKTARVLGWEAAVSGVSQIVYPGRHWINPFAEGTRENPSGRWDLSWVVRSGGYRALDARAGYFS